MTTVAELCVEGEFPALKENGDLLEWKLERITPTSFVLGLPAKDSTWFWLNCLCDRYSAEPPAWHWYNPDSKKIDDPKDIPKEGGGGNFLHPNGVICAPWNRLAYKSVDARGPHGDWQIGDWRNNRDTGACRTLSAMALRIAQELEINFNGRKAA